MDRGEEKYKKVRSMGKCHFLNDFLNCLKVWYDFERFKLQHVITWSCLTKSISITPS